MKIAELLRRAADLVDQAENPARPDETLQNPAELAVVDVGVPVAAPDNADRSIDAVMVPPLQLKTELLKRAVGVDNIYEPGEAREHEVCDDEIALLKQRAGIPVAAVMELDNDELVDD